MPLIMTVNGSAAMEVGSKIDINIDDDKSKSLIIPLINEVSPSTQFDKIEATNFTLNEKELICGIDTSDESMSNDSLVLWLSVKNKNIWQVPKTIKLEKYNNRAIPVYSHFCGGPETVRIDDSLYLHLSYENFALEENSVDHIEVIVDLSDNTATYGIFSGKRLNGRKLEGRLISSPKTGASEPVTKYITRIIDENDKLMTIAAADALSDELMEKWKSMNERASEDAAQVIFIPIPEESSISEAYDNRKFGKETGEVHSAVLMNFRDNTIICSCDKIGRKTLVWCEQQCTDKTSEKYLHTIFFEQKSTITLFYYHGRKSYKYRINLENGRITR